MVAVAALQRHQTARCAMEGLRGKYIYTVGARMRAPWEGEGETIAREGEKRSTRARGEEARDLSSLPSTDLRFARRNLLQRQSGLRDGYIGVR